ncbi:MAG: hypothetical protein JKX81_15485, partial [Arenicella sp.]|nr:hypothetical protein [Arenicella sp.]
MHATKNQQHATNTQLLAIIDGEQSEMSQHVSSCEQCQIAFTELQSFESEIGLQMFDAADKVPNNDVWERIRSSLYQNSLDQESAVGEPSDMTQQVSNVHR